MKELLFGKKFWLFICLYAAWAITLTPIIDYGDEGLQIVLALPFSILTAFVWNKLDNKFFK